MPTASSNSFLCPTCGATLEAESHFCAACGKRLEAGYVAEIERESRAEGCSACLAPITAEDQFCPNCGKRLREDALPPPVVPPSPALGLFSLVRPPGVDVQKTWTEESTDSFDGSVVEAALAAGPPLSNAVAHFYAGTSSEPAGSASSEASGTAPPEPALSSMLPMTCASCGKENPDYALMCQSCDAPLRTMQLDMPEIPPPPPLNMNGLEDLTLGGIKISCPSCRAPLELEATTCGTCGFEVRPVGRRASPDTSEMPTDLTPERVAAAATAAKLLEQDPGASAGATTPMAGRESRVSAAASGEERKGENLAGFALPARANDAEEGLSPAHFEGMGMSPRRSPRPPPVAAPAAPPVAARARVHSAPIPATVMAADLPSLTALAGQAEGSARRRGAGRWIGGVLILLAALGAGTLLLWLRRGGRDVAPESANSTADSMLPAAAPLPGASPGMSPATTEAGKFVPVPESPAPAASAVSSVDLSLPGVEAFFVQLGRAYENGDSQPFRAQADEMRIGAERDLKRYVFEVARPTVESQMPIGDPTRVEAKVSWVFKLRDKESPNAESFEVIREINYRLSFVVGAWRVDSLH